MTRKTFIITIIKLRDLSILNHHSPCKNRHSPPPTKAELGAGSGDRVVHCVTIVDGRIQCRAAAESKGNNPVKLN